MRRHQHRALKDWAIIKKKYAKPWKEPTQENIRKYREYLECCNILRDQEVYYCPFCGKPFRYVKAVFNHLDKVHETA